MDISTLQKKLSAQEKEQLTVRQRELHQDFLQGGTVQYLNYEFTVLPGVFKPRPDSIAIVQNLTINSKDKVLDVCCGSGVIGIVAALKGASSVLGLDINPVAVECARINAKKYKCLEHYEARVSDVLDALNPDEIFEVVTINPPFRDIETSSFVERTTWDQGLEVHKKFFSQIDKHLAQDGKIYLAQANFGELDQIQDILNKYGWQAELIGKNPLDAVPGLEFYAFEVTRKNHPA